MQHRPEAQAVVAADGAQLLGPGAVVLENLAIYGGAEADGADTELLDGEEVGGQFRSANVAQVAVGEDEGGEVIDALSAKKRFGD